MKLSRHLLLLSILLFCFAALQIGCWQKNDKNPVAALPDSTLVSSVAFKIVTPSNKNASFSASVRAVAENQAFVTFQLKLANFGNSLTPFSLVKKQAPVVNGSATVTFEALPNTTVIGSLQIENGNIDGFSNFHGAADLTQGSNIVELAPVGSLMPQDVLANAVSEIVSSATLLLKAPASLATELAKIVSSLPLDSTSVYEEVLNNFSNRTGLPLVELLAPASGQTFTFGSNINIVASATDLGGGISKIEFYQNSIKIGEKSSLPFSLDWQPSATGTYSVYAKAVDNNAAVGVSSFITLVVVDSAPTHTVTYNGNGSTGGSAPTDNQTYQQNAMVTVKDNTGNLVKTGYTFAGWNTAADGSGTSYNPNATFAIGTGNITLYAKWQSSAYSWTSGNATVSESNFAVGRPTAIYSGSSFSSPSAVDGNTMSRWESNRNDPGPDETNPHFLIVDLQQNREVRNIKVNISGWDSWKQNFSIFTSIDLQNWSLVASEQDKTGIFSYNIQPTSVRYVKFSSTYSADNGQVNLYELEVYGTEQVINSYSVTYNGNGNTGGSVPTDNQTYQQNATVTVADNTGNLNKTGYTFAGWNTAADGSGTSYNPAATFNMGAANITLYAKWSLVPTYTVTYNGNGNTGGSVPADNQTYQQNATVTVADNTGSLTKTGYTFAGWNTAADGSGTSYNPAATFNMGAANITLYAKWSLIPTYTVTYNGNGNTGGSAPTDNQTYQQNATVTVAGNTGNLTKTGYTFAGWNTAADGSGTSYNPAATFNMGVANITLYAQWVTISVAGVSLDKSSANLVRGATFQLIATISPTNSANQNLTWSSNNEAVAKVINGLVQCLNCGSAIISVSTQDGGFTSECSLVIRNTDEIYFTFDQSTKTITDYHTAGGSIVSIPATISGISVENIGNKAFYNKGLTSVIIPDTVVTIGASAFTYGNNLSNLIIGKNVTSIGDHAFAWNNLTSVVFPEGLLTIGGDAFGYNKLETLVIPNNVTNIYGEAFRNNNLTFVSLGERVESIGGLAFIYNSIETLTIPDSVTGVGSNAFSNNKLKSVAIGNGLTSIAEATFDKNQLTNVTIGVNVVSIKDYAFANNSLVSIVIPANVSSIGPKSFAFNQLTSITIGDNVEIDSMSFSDNPVVVSFYTFYLANSLKSGIYSGISGGSWSYSSY